MPSRLEALQQEASHLFLGRGSVVGVGISEEADRGELMFLLSNDRNETRIQVSEWARQRQVDVEFLVTGAIKNEASGKET